MKNLLIRDVRIINENKDFAGHLSIVSGKISKIYKADEMPVGHFEKIIDGNGKLLIPGVIDDQVHFREPGLTHKGDIYTESKAAIAGGVTSYMEMPNTIPQATTIELLEEKYTIASQKSLANYSFYLGATNDNIQEIKKINPKTICGVKIFMGSSTGNMLVDHIDALSAIFDESPVIITTHCEDEKTIRDNTNRYKTEFGEDLPLKYHPYIRSEETCFKSSSLAVELARKYNSRLHILHLSTKKELELLESGLSKDKKITGEVCVHHLWFSDKDYENYGMRIKWNPAIKTEEDRLGLVEGVRLNKIDIIATDHAPHTIEEKSNTYFKSPSGGPLVQHSLTAMLEFVHRNELTIHDVVKKMCHSPADVFQIDKRGYIREGYWADLVMVDLNSPWKVEKENILYKCRWSPFEGSVFKSKVSHTFVNGNLVFENGLFNETIKGQRIQFNR